MPINIYNISSYSFQRHACTAIAQNDRAPPGHRVFSRAKSRQFQASSQPPTAGKRTGCTLRRSKKPRTIMALGHTIMDSATDAAATSSYCGV